jgi:RND family efflux transporter MFP subunit
VSILDDRRREWISSQANVRGAQAALDRAALDLDYTKITAPLTGRVDRHLISIGNLVQADSSVLTTIVSLDPIDFYFDVDERRLLNFQDTAQKRGVDLQASGGGVDVTVAIGDSSRRKFEGKLNFAENRVDGDSGTLRVRARFPNPNLTLQPGLFGRIQVEAGNTYKAVLVPDEAISSNQNERIVFTVDDGGTVRTKAVRTGPKLNGYRVIRTGLDGSETIVINGLVRIQAGAKVTPRMTELPQTAIVTETE